MDELMLPLGLLDARSPASVLVVDDNAGKRLAVRAMLAPLGHAIVEVESGRAALLAIEQQSFAVILMDVSMPILKGYETAKLIRQRIESASTPIIFLTAYGRDETETASAYASGAVDFISRRSLPTSCAPRSRPSSTSSSSPGSCSARWSRSRR